jgi:hypothetical protein
VILQILVLVSVLAAPRAPACAYPDELPQYRLCAAAPWRSLRPLESTFADTRAILGKPTQEWDDTNFDDESVPYPGDEAAKEPRLRFDDGGLWIIEVQLVRTDEAARSVYPAALHDRLLSVALIPRHKTSFARVAFPPSFVKSHFVDRGYHEFAWDEYRHASGLAYYICTSSTPSSEVQPGDLFRIIYGVSDQARKAHGAVNGRGHR